MFEAATPYITSRINSALVGDKTSMFSTQELANILLSYSVMGLYPVQLFKMAWKLLGFESDDFSNAATSGNHSLKSMSKQTMMSANLWI